MYGKPHDYRLRSPSTPTHESNRRVSRPRSAGPSRCCRDARTDYGCSPPGTLGPGVEVVSSVGPPSSAADEGPRQNGTANHPPTYLFRSISAVAPNAGRSEVSGLARSPAVPGPSPEVSGVFVSESAQTGSRRQDAGSVRVADSLLESWFIGRSSCDGSRVDGPFPGAPRAPPAARPTPLSRIPGHPLGHPRRVRLPPSCSPREKNGQVPWTRKKNFFTKVNSIFFFSFLFRDTTTV